MIACQRGDVVLVLYPNSDLRTAKRKPALVVQADDLNTGIDQVIIAMITSNLKRKGHPSRYFVSLDSEVGKQSGLLTDSVVLADNLTTVLRKGIDARLGYLVDMTPVDECLRITLGL